MFRLATPALTGSLAAAASAPSLSRCAWFDRSDHTSQPSRDIPTPKKQYTLNYFPVPGPGEPVRAMLALGGYDWKDEIITGKEWSVLKPKTKWGQMPVLKAADGRELTQAKAICRFLAKEVSLQDGKKLYPSDHWLAFQVDEFVDTFDDIRMKILPTFAVKDQKEKEAARAALFATDGSGAIFEGFKKVEAQLKGNGHMVGDSFTLADIYAFYQVNMFRAGFLDGIPTEGWIDKLPKLKAVVDKVAREPAIKSYYSTKAAASKLYTPHASG